MLWEENANTHGCEVNALYDNAFIYVQIGTSYFLCGSVCMYICAHTHVE